MCLKAAYSSETIWILFKLFLAITMYVLYLFPVIIIVRVSLGIHILGNWTEAATVC